MDGTKVRNKIEKEMRRVVPIQPKERVIPKINNTH